MEFKNPFRRNKQKSPEQYTGPKLVPLQETGEPFALTEDMGENVVNFREAVAKFDEGSPREMTFGEKLTAMVEDQERRALLGEPGIDWTPVEVIEIHQFEGEDPRVVDHRMEDWLHEPGNTPFGNTRIQEEQ